MGKKKNKECPHCKAAQRPVVKGTKKDGPRGNIQKYYCHDCNTYFTGNPIGRPRLGEQALSGAEKSKRYYASLTPEERRAYNKKRRKPKQKKTGEVKKTD